MQLGLALAAHELCSAGRMG